MKRVLVALCLVLALLIGESIHAPLEVSSPANDPTVTVLSAIQVDRQECCDGHADPRRVVTVHCLTDTILTETADTAPATCYFGRARPMRVAVPGGRIPEGPSEPPDLRS